jgi:hypothetical protein
MSHLVGLWPGETISPFYNASVAAAAKVSTDIRGTGDIGWGKAWRLNLRARLLDGERAYYYVTNIVADPKCAANLMFHDSPNRQMDAIFGAMSGVAELFLQSQSGEVFLLPALPSKWTNGSVSGLCARGGFEVDIHWRSNRLASASILSKIGNPCRVRSKWPISVKSGSQFIEAPMVLPGLWEFATIAGSNYTIVPSTVVETELLTATASVGDAHHVVKNLAFSRAEGTRLNANVVGDFVAYSVTNLSAGKYRVHVVANAGLDAGRFQLSGGAAGNSLTNIGSAHDTYSPTNVVYLLATNSPPLSYLSTNMLKEYDCGPVEIGRDGDFNFKFTIIGKNAASSGHALTVDYIKLTPMPPVSLSPVLEASLSDDSLVLSWPTDAAGFSLEYTNDISSSNWIWSSSTALTIGTRRYVTNKPDRHQAFYRLIRNAQAGAAF